MITPVTLRLVDESARFALKFSCPDCVHYDPRAAACGNGYPAEPHLEPALEDRSEVVFCKEFELG